MSHPYPSFGKTRQATLPERPSARATAVSPIVLALLLALATTNQPARAQTFKVLHTFHGPNGAKSTGIVVRDSAGNIYGTTGVGGGGKCQYGCGTVFKLDSAGKQDWLYHFDGPDGYIPPAGLLRDAATGNLFGTTEYGGDAKCDPSTYGCGTVFELDKTGKKEKVLHKFTGYPDGGFTQAYVAEDGEGNLYGTSRGAGNGAVFKIDTAGKETILYNFSGGSDGCDPGPGVILDSAGNLYGVTFYGGVGFCNSGYGVVFELDTSGNETVLHTFVGSDGANPDSVLLFDSAGNLYGGTENGGSSDECGFSGCGTVFKLTPQSGGGWAETVLYSFCSLTNCTDGEEESGGGPLAIDAAGNLYGTAFFGGSYRNCNGDGCGVVFELDTAGKETVLHSFTGGADGAFPAGVILDSHNDLYGTTQEGGDLKCEPKYGGCGVVFKISP